MGELYNYSELLEKEVTFYRSLPTSADYYLDDKVLNEFNMNRLLYDELLLRREILSNKDQIDNIKYDEFKRAIDKIKEENTTFAETFPNSFQSIRKNLEDDELLLYFYTYN